VAARAIHGLKAVFVGQVLGIRVLVAPETPDLRVRRAPMRSGVHEHGDFRAVAEAGEVLPLVAHHAEIGVLGERDGKAGESGKQQPTVTKKTHVFVLTHPTH
jgi:hypothetical protein